MQLHGSHIGRNMRLIDAVQLKLSFKQGNLKREQIQPVDKAVNQ